MTEQQHSLAKQAVSILFIGFVGLGIWSCDEQPQSVRDAEDVLLSRKTDARIVSEKYVRRFLKYPDDATFPFWTLPDISWNEEQNVFLVSSKVKAKNVFGAELTYRWLTIVRLEANTWKLLHCVIDGKTVYESKQPLASSSAVSIPEASTPPRSPAEDEGTGLHTFVHKDTGEVLTGTLLGTVSVKGAADYLVRLKNGRQRRLPMSSWGIQKEAHADTEPAKE